MLDQLSSNKQTTIIVVQNSTMRAIVATEEFELDEIGCPVGVLNATASMPTPRSRILDQIQQCGP